MLEIKYKEHKFPSYRYDTTVNEVVNINRNNRPIKPSNVKGTFYVPIQNLLGKQVLINVKYISPEYAEKFNQLKQLDNVSMNTYDEVNTAVVKESNKPSRREILEMMGLPSSPIWISDIDTLVKAHKLIDDMSYEELIYLEERGAHTMVQFNIDDPRRMCDVMVQIAAKEVLAKEEAEKKVYRKEYNQLTLPMLRQTVMAIEDPDLEKYIVENWKAQLRERFFFHIVYYNKGVTLRGYDTIRIPLTTIEEVQAAFKLLTELFGWKEQQ